VGGNTKDARGGAEFVDLFEMGGNNNDGSWGWNTNRPTWEIPIHELMVKYKVNIFLHGHDHFFGKQEKDGIVYQVVPQPSNRNITNVQASEYGYVNGVFLPGRGFLQVTVSPESVKVDYIQAYLPSEENATRKNGEVAYSYTLKSAVTSAELLITIPDDPGLEQNFPNPFNQETTISYQIPKTGYVALKVYDLMGREIAQLVNQTQTSGNYSVRFNAAEHDIPKGMYYCRLTVGNYSKNIKILCSRSK
jgi:hypothetical protein